MSSDINYEYRTGIGTDIHRLVPGRDLVLGGVKIPYKEGLLAHSDGDVVLHAVIDALLGAAGMGDIGDLFPDTNEKFKDADSRELLQIVKERLEEKKWEVVNVDLIVHAEQPKLCDVKGHIKRCVSSILGVDFVNVNVKAKTNEGLGDVGLGKAISSTVTVMLRRRIKRAL